MTRPRTRTATALLVAFAALAVLPATAAPGHAADAIELSIDIAHVLRLERPAGTVIIGNPNIADATVLDARTFVLTGKTTGRTNLIVLDQTGDGVSDFSVRVTDGSGRFLNVRAGERHRTFFCNGVCENAPSPELRQGPASPDVASMPDGEDDQPAAEEVPADAGTADVPSG